MKKRRILLSVLALVLVTVLCAALFVACDPNKPTDKYTITFVDGNPATVEVKVGESLTAEQIPTYTGTVPADKAFDHWAVAGADDAPTDVRVEAGYTPEADVKAVAVFKDRFTLSFYINKGDAQAYAEFQFDLNEKPSDNDKIPADPDNYVPDGFVFNGWKTAAGAAFNAEAGVTANVTYYAEFERTSYVVRFRNEGQDDVVKHIAVVEEGDAKLTADDIPALAAKTDYVARGWFDEDGVKAEADVVIDDDIVFEACYVNEESYKNTVWANDEEHVALWFDDANGVYGFTGLSTTSDENVATYQAADGTMKIQAGFGYSTDTWIFAYNGNTIAVDHTYYDETEDQVSDSYVLTLQAESELEGQYLGYYGTDKLIVTDGGVATSFDYGTTPRYARFYEAEGKLMFEYWEDMDVTQGDVYEVTLHDEGYMELVDADDDYYIYVKANSVKSHSAAGDSYDGLYEYDVDGANKAWVYRYSSNGYQYYWATVTGNTEANGVFKVSYNGKELWCKFDEDADYFDNTGHQPQTYVGTINNENVEITDDGFGGMTIKIGAAEPQQLDGLVFNPAEDKIHLGYMVVLDEQQEEQEIAFVFDVEAGTFEVAVPDEWKDVEYVYADDYHEFTLKLDGLGRFSVEYESYGEPATDNGFYAVFDDRIVFYSDSSYLFSGFATGTYQRYENDNVLSNEEKSQTITKEGYTINHYEDFFLGYWEDEEGNGLYFYIEEGRYGTYYYAEVVGNDKLSELELTFNYNGTIATKQVYGDNGYVDLIFELVGYTPQSATKLAYTDMDGVRTEYTYKQNDKPFPGFEDVLIGDWHTADGEIELKLEAKDATLNNVAVTKLKYDDSYGVNYTFKATYNDVDTLFTLNVINGAFKIYIGEDDFNGVVLYPTSNPTIDPAQYGKYTGKYKTNNDEIQGEFDATIEIGADGVKLNGQVATMYYALIGEDIDGFAFHIAGLTGFAYAEGDFIVNIDLPIANLQHAVEDYNASKLVQDGLTDMIGVWSYTNGGSTNYLFFFKDGSVWLKKSNTYDGLFYAEDGVFKCDDLDSEQWTIVLAADKQSITVSSTLYGGYAGTYNDTTFNKVAVATAQANDPIIKTWNHSDDTYTFSLDAQSALQVNDGSDSYPVIKYGNDLYIAEFADGAHVFSFKEGTRNYALVDLYMDYIFYNVAYIPTGTNISESDSIVGEWKGTTYTIVIDADGTVKEDTHVADAIKKLDANVYYIENLDAEDILAIVDGNNMTIINLSRTYYNGEYQKQAVVPDAVFAGTTWKGQNPSKVDVTISFTADKVSYNGSEVGPYTVKGNVASWTDADGNAWSATMSGDQQSVTIDWEYDYNAMTSYTLSRDGGGVPSEDDAFKGTWKDESGNIYTFDGKGQGVYNNGTEYPFSYTVVGNKATFSASAFEFECTVNGASMSVSFDDGDGPYSTTATKQAEQEEEDPNAEIHEKLNGKWQGFQANKQEYFYQYEFDGKGGLKVYIFDYEGQSSPEYTYSGTYTIAEGKISTVASNLRATVVIVDDNHITITYDGDDYTVARDGYIEKVVTPEADYVGIWEASDWEGSYTIELKADHSGTYTLEMDGDPSENPFTWTYNAADGTISTTLFSGTAMSINSAGKLSAVDMQFTKKEVTPPPTVPQEAEYYGTWTVSDGDGEYEIVINQAANGGTLEYNADPGSYEGEDIALTSFTWTYAEGKITFTANKINFTLSIEDGKCYLTVGTWKCPTACTKTASSESGPQEQETDYQSLIQGAWEYDDSEEQTLYTFTFDGNGQVTIAWEETFAYGEEASTQVAYTVDAQGNVSFDASGFAGLNAVTGTISADGKLTLTLWEDECTLTK